VIEIDPAESLVSVMHDPYAPPADPDATLPAGTVPTAFSDDTVRVVGSLATSMRVVSFFYFAVAGVGFLVLMLFMLQAPSGIVLAAGVPIAFVITAAVWVREAAERFQRGVLDSDIDVLGRGFVSLRKYLILFGVLGIVQLAFTLMGMV
jgi:hypothetical protein